MKFKNAPLDAYGISAFLVIFAFSLVAGLRDPTVGTDTANYISIFQSAVLGEEGVRSIEPGFLLLTKSLSFLENQSLYLFMITFFISILFCGVGALRLNWRFTVYVFLVFSLPFFYGLTLNILRQGLAFGIILRFVILSKPSYLRGAFFIVVAGSMHYSALFFGPMALIAMRMRRNHVIFFWLICVALGYFDVLKNFSNHLSLLADDYYASYFDDKMDDYKIGYRADFIAFSIVGALASLGILRSDRASTLRDVGFANPLDVAGIFFVFNGLANLFINLPYSDRYFSWSWCLYPMLMASLIFMYIKPRYAKFFVFLLFPVVLYMVGENVFV